MPIQNYSLPSNSQFSYRNQPSYAEQPSSPSTNILENLANTYVAEYLPTYNIPNNVSSEVDNLTGQSSKEQTHLNSILIGFEPYQPPTLKSFEEIFFDYIDDDTDYYNPTPSPRLLDRLTNCFCCCFSKRN